MELYNSNNMDLSKNSRLRLIQEKILKNEDLSLGEKLLAGRDYPIKEINGYVLKSDHCYRAINQKMFDLYKETGYIIGTGADDEYEEMVEDGTTYNNNRGVDWYLGGVDLKYGNIILECPAYKEYFTPAQDNGCGMSFDPTVRFMKSSGTKKPIPISIITNVFDASLQYEESKEFKRK